MFRNFAEKNLLLKETIRDIINETKNAMYSVDINSTFEECLSFIAFLLAIKQLSAVGIPVVVTDRHIIKKLNIIWYMPSPVSPKALDKNTLYIKPKILTIKLDTNKIAVDITRYGIFKKTPPYVKYIRKEVKKFIIYIFINSGFILSNRVTYLNPRSFSTE